VEFVAHDFMFSVIALAGASGTKIVYCYFVVLVIHAEKSIVQEILQFSYKLCKVGFQVSWLCFATKKR